MAEWLASRCLHSPNQYLLCLPDYVYYACYEFLINWGMCAMKALSLLSVGTNGSSQLLKIYPNQILTLKKYSTAVATLYVNSSHFHSCWRYVCLILYSYSLSIIIVYTCLLSSHLVFYLIICFLRHFVY
jgi:hypothetical protein